jgi:hypothetical protein
MDAATTGALVEESARRSSLVWVRRSGSQARARALWHVWQDGSAYLLTGGIEQPMPDGLDRPDAEGAQAEVTARSKDKGSRLVVWQASVHIVEPGSEEWDAVTPALASARLNSPDGARAPERWARECQLLRLTPTPV